MCHFVVLYFVLRNQIQVLAKLMVKDRNKTVMELVQYKAPRALRSSDKKLLQVPHFKLKTYGGRWFSYIASYLWNQLPHAIRQSPSLATFKSNLKTYLFDQVFN